MAVHLRTHSTQAPRTTLGFMVHHWAFLTWLALDHDWIPPDAAVLSRNAEKIEDAILHVGTPRPRFVFSCEEAADFAAALERGLARTSATYVEHASDADILRHYLAGADRSEMPAPVVYFSGGGQRLLKDMIAFTRQGPFEMTL